MPDGSALAITDHDTMAGYVDHHDACKKHDVTPIYGVEITLENGRHLTLLAMNQEGYHNLCRMMHKTKTQETLAAHAEGVICLSGDLNSPMAVALLERDMATFRKWWKFLQSTYEDRLYLELIDHGLQEQKFVNHHLKKLPTPTIQTNDVHYPSPSDARAHAVYMADKLDRYIDLEWALYHGVDQAYLCEMPDQKVADEIVGRCSFDLSVDEVDPILPNFAPPDDYKTYTDVPEDPQEKYLLNLGIQGLVDRLDDKTTLKETYLPRLRHEWEVVCEMGYAGYYLIVHDFIEYAHKSGIPVGPGRGSGAGSLLAYALRITDIDPIKHGLLFERFLNPERVSMPDFDIDFAYRKREEVIEYVKKNYGEKSVSAICTYGTCKPKEAWKTAARPLGISQELQDNFSDRYLPETKEGKSFDEIDLQEALQNHPEAEEAVEIASELEGAIRSVGRHAAGFVITPKQVEEYAPLSPEDRAVQFEMEAAERMGLVKFDFLGLKELDVIDYTQELVGERLEMPHGDEETLEYITQGHTLGMFQISSEGFQEMMPKMKPEEFGDITASVALYRPGPKDAGMIDEYIARKNGEKEIEYPHPDLEECLEETYGVVVYQEQVMQIAQIIAGYSLGEADILRRAMGKKKEKVMNQQKPKFLRQAQERGYSEELAKELWSQIDTFSDYGFNKCLTGDTVLERARANQYVDRHFTIKELYEAQQQRDENGHLTSWAQKIQSGRQRILQYYSDERIRPGYVKGVHKNGVKEIFEVTLSCGRSVKATKNHRFLTDEGYQSVENLETGDHLVVKGEEGKDRPGHHTTRARGRSYEGEGFKAGEENPSYIDGRTRRFEESKSEVLDRSGGICEECGYDQENHRYEFAHKISLEDLDFDYSSYHDPSNILYLCNSCHKKLDYEKGERRPAWSKGKPSSISEVISIEYAGEEMTYDVEMDDPRHNFLANGIVSHNSHAASYAQIAWETAYLKTHHRAELLAAQMDIRHGDAEKVSDFIRDAEREGIPVEEPNVQYSSYRFTTRDDAIQVGLCAIKNLNDDVAHRVAEHPPYRDLPDLVMSVEMSKGDLEALLQAGALDDVLGADGLEEKCRLRGALEDQLKDVLNAADGYSDQEQNELFSPNEIGIAFDPTRGSAWDPRELAKYEYDKLERYRTFHPAKILKEGNPVVDIENWREESSSVFNICGVIRKVNDFETTNGNMMGFVLLEDETGEVDVTVFPRQWDPEVFTERSVMCYTVERDKYRGEPTLNLQKICKNSPQEQKTSQTNELTAFT